MDDSNNEEKEDAMRNLESSKQMIEFNVTQTSDEPAINCVTSLNAVAIVTTECNSSEYNGLVIEPSDASPTRFDNYTITNQTPQSPSSDRPYKCTWNCGKYFKRKDHLQNHVRTHTGERPYQCTIKDCNKTFLRSDHLTHHIRTHTGEKPFRCDTCGIGFSRSDRLRVHMNSHLLSNVDSKSNYQSTDTVSLSRINPDYSTHAAGILDQNCVVNYTSIAENDIRHSQENDSLFENVQGEMYLGESDGPSNKIARCILKANDLIATPIESNSVLVKHEPIDDSILANEIRSHSEMNSNEDVDNFVRLDKYKYFCHLCGQCFSRKDNYSRHLKVHMPEKQSQPLNNGDLYQQTTIPEDDGNIYACGYCDSRFNQEPSLMEHLNTHASKNGQKMSVLLVSAVEELSNNDQMYSNSEQSSSAYQSTVGEDDNTTTTSDESAISFIGDTVCLNGENYNVQMLGLDDVSLASSYQVNEESASHFLLTCSPTSNLMTDFNVEASENFQNDMQQNFAPEENKNACPYCSKSFKRKDHLQNHVRTHTGERPYECSEEFCDRAFSRRDHLQAHMRTHAGPKSFKCTVEECGIFFDNTDALKNHILEAHVESDPQVTPILYQVPENESELNEISLLESQRHLESQVTYEGEMSILNNDDDILKLEALESDVKMEGCEVDLEIRHTDYEVKVEGEEEEVIYRNGRLELVSLSEANRFSEYDVDVGASNSCERISVISEHKSTDCGSPKRAKIQEWDSSDCFRATVLTRTSDSLNNDARESTTDMEYDGVSDISIKLESGDSLLFKENLLPPYFCSICEKVFEKKSALDKHSQSHGVEGPYICGVDDCQAKFTRADTLKIHRSSHSQSKMNCTVCGKSILGTELLSAHMRTHNGEKPYPCPFGCGKSFNRNDHLSYHIRKHTGEKPYACPECSECFIRSDHLKYHMSIHTGLYAFRCEFCEKAFNKKELYLYHVRSHTGEKPYVCEFCPVAYSRPDRLKKHRLTHNVENYDCCKICGKFYLKGDAFQEHNRTFHEENS